MIVIRIAITPSLNASRRPLLIGPSQLRAGAYPRGDLRARLHGAVRSRVEEGDGRLSGRRVLFQPAVELDVLGDEFGRRVPPLRAGAQARGQLAVVADEPEVVNRREEAALRERLDAVRHGEARAEEGDG